MSTPLSVRERVQAIEKVVTPVATADAAPTSAPQPLPSPSAASARPTCASRMQSVLSLYLIILVLVEVAAIARLALGEKLHSVVPFYGAGKRSASFVTLAQVFLGILMLTRLNVLFSPASVGALRVCAWIHVLEAA